jgi:hypothetical protein
MSAPVPLYSVPQAFDSVRALLARAKTILSGTFIAAGTYTSQQISIFNPIIAPGQTLAILFNLTAVSGTGSVTLRVEQQDPVSGIWVGVCTDAVRTTTATALLHIGPGSTRVGGMANFGMTAYQTQLLGAVRVVVSHADGSNYTYGVTWQAG